MNAIEKLQAQRIPTQSFVAAVQHLTQEHLPPEDYRAAIFELSGHETQASDEYVRHHYLYLVQETIRQFNKTGTVDMGEMFKLSAERATHFITNNPWVFSKPEDESSPSYRAPKLDAAGNPKQKKGAKRDQAVALWKKHKDENLSRKQWIDLLVKEVGLTPAGASTYHSNLRSGAYK